MGIKPSMMNVKLVSNLIFIWILKSQSSLTVNAQSSCNNEVPDKNLNQILSEGSLNFSLNLYKELKNGPNVFFSPFSVRVALAMTAQGARGTTLTQMNNVLQLQGFQNENQMNNAFHYNLISFCPNSNYALSTANRIYVQQDFPISNSFAQTLEKYYLSSAKNVNFIADGNGIANQINSWVEQQTNDTIKNLIAPGNLSPDTVLVLVNAIYFKGKWKKQFNPADTKPRTFNLANGRSVQVPTMYVHSNMKITYSAALKSQVLQLNYDGDRLAMDIILPDVGTSLNSVQQNLNSKNVNDYINDLSNKEVEVYLPKFKVSYKEELNIPLQTLGMINVFGPSADLTRITYVRGRLSVSDVIHQAFVAVDEEGTTAAAATAVGMAMAVGMSPSPIEFRVDRPCIYLICDLKFKQILFMGNLDDPSS